MGLEPTSPHRTERCKSLSTAVCRALDSPARGGGAGSERAPGPAGRGAGGAALGPSRALPSQGLGLGPRRTAGGAKAWPFAALGSGPCASMRGAWHCLAFPRPQGGPDPRPPTLPTLLRLRSWAGPESSDRAGRSGDDGSIIHGAPGRAPKTCSALASSGEVGRRQGKSSQSKVGHISHFSQVSTEHLLEAWHLDWGCCQGFGEKREGFAGPQSSRRKQCLRRLRLGTGSSRGRKAWILSGLRLSSFPFSSFLPAASPWLHPFSSIPPTLPCSPCLFTGGSLLPARSRC